MSAWRFTSALILLMGAGVVSAAEPTDATPQASPQILINSHTLVYRSKDNTAEFEGEVVLTKGVFVMHADRMIVYFEGAATAPSLPGPTPAPKNGAKTASPAPNSAAATDLPTFGNRSVSVIEAFGNVLLQQGQKRAKSQKAVYHQRSDTLVLTIEPEAWESGYRVTGTKITMFVKEDRSIVENSRVVITDSDSKSAAKP